MCNLINCFGTSEAYATIIAALIGLIGGIAAVIGAIVVAGKQSKILENQTTAQTAADDRAHAMEELRFRSDLFDRRMTIYDGAREYLSFVIDKYVHGFSVEGMTTDEIIALEMQKTREFARAMRLADFLCPHPLRLTLFSISRTTTELRSVKRKIKRLQERDPTTEAESVEWGKLIDRESEIEMKLIDLDAILSDEFAPIMKLTPDESAQTDAVTAAK